MALEIDGELFYLYKGRLLTYEEAEKIFSNLFAQYNSGYFLNTFTPKI